MAHGINGKKITVNTGLNGFIVVDRIIQADEQDISGIKTVADAPACLVLESLAQLGAFHVRYITNFQRHAFLLKIGRCVMPAQEKLDGTYQLSATLVNRSAAAFSYRLRARSEGRVCMEGEFLFATVDYNQVFKKERLQEHYRNVFSCLQNDLKKE
jgi:hypothetical protein